MKDKILLVLAALAACMLVTVVLQDRKIDQLTAERDKYKENTETLLEQTATFNVRDSLNAAKVGTLELTLKEFEKYRADDAALIKDLKGKNRDLEGVNKAQAQTIIRLQNVPRDTVILRDSVPVQAKSVRCGDAWYSFEGLLTEDEFTGTLTNREELLLTETVRYKKFLFWKTKRVKDRELEAVSRNPHTTIESLEHIIIDD